MRIKSHKVDIFYWTLAVLPLFITLLVYPTLPEIIPAHYGADNQVNRWGSRNEAFIFPLVNLLIIAPLFSFIGNLSYGSSGIGDPEQRLELNKKVTRASGYVVMIIFNILNCLILFTSISKITNLNAIGFNRVLTAVLSLGEIMLGNYLPKCKRNAVIGIRVPWTLENDEVWYKSHRFGGKMTVCSGALSLVLCPIVPQNMVLILFMAILLISSAIEVIYSHHIYISLKKNN